MVSWLLTLKSHVWMIQSPVMITKIDKFLNKGSYSVATGMEYQEYLSEYAFLMKHCVKKTNAIEFIKCMDNPKCNRFEQKPIQENNFMEFIKQAGWRMFTPTPDPSCQGHYYTSTV